MTGCFRTLSWAPWAQVPQREAPGGIKGHRRPGGTGHVKTQCGSFPFTQSDRSEVNPDSDLCPFSSSAANTPVSHLGAGLPRARALELRFRTSAMVKILYISGRMTGATSGICVSVTSRVNSAKKKQYRKTRLPCKHTECERFQAASGGSTPTDRVQVWTLAWWPSPGEGKLQELLSICYKGKENNTEIKANTGN